MRHIKTNSDTREIFAFDSMTDFVNECDPTQFEKRTAGFVGERLPTWCAVDERSKRDWAEGMYILQQYVDKLSKESIPEIKSRKRRTEFSSDNGDEVDYDRLMSGQEFWRTSKRERVEGESTVTIVIDTTTPASTDVEHILWRGASAIALTKILEDKGYSVELWVVNGSELYSREETKVMTACCLKQASDPLDTSTIINTVAGWFYRTVTFTLVRTLARKQGKVAEPSLGRCYSPDQNDLDNLSTDENRVYSSGVFSFDGALSLMIAELQKLSDME